MAEEHIIRLSHHNPQQEPTTTKRQTSASTKYLPRSLTSSTHSDYLHGAGVVAVQVRLDLGHSTHLDHITRDTLLNHSNFVLQVYGRAP